MGYWEYPAYVTVGEKRAKAEKKMKQLMKKNPHIRPVIIKGNSIASTWWGKSWNKNLERYADYSNRIGRGRSYVRHGALLDLQISPGTVTSLVQGSTSSPYSVEIKIEALKKDIWKGIKARCEGKLESLQELLDGKFPKELSDMFAAEGKGLFPTPKEISFTCSCPDWASMCKHVAATLYGAGARLDEEPELFFKMRKVNIDDLISGAVKAKTKKILEKTKVKSARVLSEGNISGLFGIDMDDDVKVKGVTKKVASKKKSTPAQSKKSKPSAKKAVTKIVKKSVSKSTGSVVKKKSAAKKKKIVAQNVSKKTTLKKGVKKVVKRKVTKKKASKKTVTKKK